MSDSLSPKSGFAALVGYELRLWQEDAAEVGLIVGRQHINRSGVLHGGALATLIDSACGYAGCYSPEGAPPKRAFTLSLTNNFIAAAAEGSRLTASAQRTGGGRSVFFARCEVHDQDGRLIGSGEGVFKYIAGHK